MITHEQIRDAAIAEACRQFNMEPAVILGRPRSESEAIARHAVCAALRSIGLPFSAIAELVNRSHGAAMNSLKRHNDMMSTSHVYRARADAVICAAQMARDGKTPEPPPTGPATTPIGNQIQILADQVKHLEQDLAHRLKQLRDCMTEKDRLLNRIRETSAAAVILGEVKP